MGEKITSVLDLQAQPPGADLFRHRLRYQPGREELSLSNAIW